MRPLPRRRFLVLVAGTATLAVSCRTSAPADDTTFAEPWSDLVDDDMTAFGRRAAEIDPGCIEHARARLAGDGPEPASRLDRACDEDARSGAVVDVDGWLLPRTLAGLAAALAARG